MTQVDLIIIVGPKDLEIFYELCRSIQKYWKPVNTSTVHIYFHSNDKRYIKEILKKNLNSRLVYKFYIREKEKINPALNSYLTQRILKIKAPLRSNSDYIWYLDCDYLLQNYNTEQSLIREKIQHLTVPFNSESDLVWLNDSTEVLGSQIEANYMVDGWNLYPTQILKELAIRLDKTEYELFPNFSEFYVMGQFVKNHPNSKNIEFTKSEQSSRSRCLNQDTNTGEIKLSNYSEILAASNFDTIILWSHWDECARIMNFLNSKLRNQSLEHYVEVVDKKRFRVFHDLSKSIENNLLRTFFSYSDGWLHSEIYFKAHSTSIFNKFEILDGVKMEFYINLFFKNFWIKIQSKLLLKYLLSPIKIKFILKFTNGVLEKNTGRKLYAKIID